MKGRVFLDQMAEGLVRLEKGLKMVKFYKNMLEKNLDKTEALRQAKLELLKNKNYSSPLFWSAFVMYGE